MKKNIKLLEYAKRHRGPEAYLDLIDLYEKLESLEESLIGRRYIQNHIYDDDIDDDDD